MRAPRSTPCSTPRRVFLVVAAVFFTTGMVTSLAACELLSPPSVSAYGEACGVDRVCSATTTCVDGFCEPSRDDDVDAGSSDAGAADAG